VIYLDENLNKYTLNFNDQDVSREELINVFEILYEKGLIKKNELQRAITIANNKYKSLRQIMNDSVTKSDIE
jgi:hypothetical protein